MGILYMLNNEVDETRVEKYKGKLTDIDSDDRRYYVTENDKIEVTMFCSNGSQFMCDGLPCVYLEEENDAYAKDLLVRYYTKMIDENIRYLQRKKCKLELAYKPEYTERNLECVEVLRH